MAKVTCSLSGLQLEVSHFPLNIDVKGYHHPIFLLSKKELLAVTPKYFRGELTAVDSYLLFLALLDSTSLLKWSTNARYTEKTSGIIARTMESLIKVIGNLDIISNPSLQLPMISINPDTQSLGNAGAWVFNWNKSLTDFMDGNRSRTLAEQIARREEVLSRMLKSSAPLSHYAGVLSFWASDAAEFPNLKISILSRKEKTLAEYWRTIITSCAANDLKGIPKNHITELKDHCLDNINFSEVDTLYSRELFRLLDSGLLSFSVNHSIGMGLISNSKPNYSILDDDDNVEDANKRAMILQAPESAPIKENYATTPAGKLEYLKAMSRYNLANKYKG